MSELDIHREAIRKGSKSFAAASLFFSKEQKEAAWRLYSWCRHCDDQIDEASQGQMMLRLETLREQLNLGIHSSSLAFRGFAQVSERYSIPVEYPLHLLRGMEMDAAGRSYSSLQELEEYCFCVAGVVGLMMCHVMGVTSDSALPHAVSLGNAMQLTNICRDIREDFERGRIYLPLNWLAESGIPRQELMSPIHRNQVLQMQQRLLSRADELYQHGYKGLSYLGLRSAWAVLIAGYVYSHIGSKIRNTAGHGLDERIYVTGVEKLVLIGKATAVLIGLWVRERIGKTPFRSPQKVWRL
ncbi:phytoene/squalene synthase family protein [Bdellovibrio sp. HCB290]|uniref:phytoene/squalene synthase family protein n=1 Tax=Bdellovibrio sp. HCB290 TaxID=3394356 RepID=UPI0039B421E9